MENRQKIILTPPLIFLIQCSSSYCIAQQSTAVHCDLSNEKVVPLCFSLCLSFVKYKALLPSITSVQCHLSLFWLTSYVYVHQCIIIMNHTLQLTPEYTMAKIKHYNTIASHVHIALKICTRHRTLCTVHSSYIRGSKFQTTTMLHYIPGAWKLCVC